MGRSAISHFVLCQAFFICLNLAAATDSAPAQFRLPDIFKGSGMSKESKVETIAKGVRFVETHFRDFSGDGPLSAYWLVIRWDEAQGGVSLNIARNPKRRERPTALGSANNALATVNGAYHLQEDPSTPFYQLKVDGKLIPSLHPDSGDGTMAFNRGEMPYIGRFGKELLEKYDNVISADGIPMAKGRTDCSDRSPEAVKRRKSMRAPRTFAGNIISNRTTVIGVADGRMRQSTGLDYREIRYLLEGWGCEPHAMMALDGGGSSVMAVRNGDRLEIRNRPSDAFPLILERRVAEALQIVDEKSAAERR